MRNGFDARASGVTEAAAVPAVVPAAANPAKATDGDGSDAGVAFGVSLATETLASKGDETGKGAGAGVVPWPSPPNAANAADGEYPGVDTTVAGVAACDSSGGPVAGAEAYPGAPAAGVAYRDKPAGGTSAGDAGSGVDIGAGIGAERQPEGPGGGGVCAFDAAAAAAVAAAARAASA